MTLRLGELMESRGLLTREQVVEALEQQREFGGAFGQIVERMFGLSPALVESLWAEQYASITSRIDPREEIVERDALRAVDRRQAWQFQVVPLRWDGEDLVVCTTAENLPRAVRFVYRRLKTPAYFVLAEPGSLREALAYHFPLPGAAEAALGARAAV